MDSMRRTQAASGFAPIENEADEPQTTISYSNAVKHCDPEALIRKNIETLEKREIPDAWIFDRSITGIPRGINGQLTFNDKTYTNYRDFIIDTFSMYGLVDKNWTKKLADEFSKLNIKKCLEVGGGKGWLSKALSEHSVDVVCTDIKLRFSVSNVETMDAVSAIEKYADQADALIISWPYSEADQFIKAWPNDKWVVYIGEGPTGCTADIYFFEHFKLNKVIVVPAWSGIHDACLIGKKVEHSDDYNSKGIMQESSHKLFPDEISSHW